MQPTRRPWTGWTWAGWQALEAGVAGERAARRRGGRARGGGARARERVDMRYAWRQRHDIPPNAFYSPNQIKHLIRWEAAIGVPTLPPTWIRDGRPWRLSENTGRPEPRVTIRPWSAMGSPNDITRPEMPQGTMTWWEGAVCSIPLAAALVAGLIMMVKGVDKLLNATFFKPLDNRRRRRQRRLQSEEWPTPSVLVTNLSVRLPSEGAGGEGGGGIGDVADPPPPYAEAVAEPKVAEEPPPPYSSSYVTFSNPPERSPTVYLYTRRHTRLRYGYEEGRSGLLDDGDTGPPPPAAVAQGDLVPRAEYGHVVQRKEAPPAPAADHNLNQNDDDMLVVHCVNAPGDGAVSNVTNTGTNLESDRRLYYQILNQQDKYFDV